MDNAQGAIIASLSQSVVPLLSRDAINKMLKFIEREDLLQAVIHCLLVNGANVEIKWLEYQGNNLAERIFVVSNPKWLADLLKTVVTVGGGIVKNELISRKQLIGLWSHLECEKEPLI